MQEVHLEHGRRSSKSNGSYGNGSKKHVLQLGQLPLLKPTVEDESRESLSSDPRDTQFVGFAALLIDHLPWEDLLIEGEEEGWQERWETVAAQGLYDFACHVAIHAQASAHGDMDKIPDMIEWQVKGQEG